MRKKKKVSAFESQRLVRLYVPPEKVRKYWYLFDRFALAPDGADHLEFLDFLSFIKKVFNDIDLSNWGYDCDDIFTPYIYMMDREKE